MEERRTDCAARTHLVLIPSYNTGTMLFGTVAEACRYWQPVWVVIDGSTDGSGEALAECSQQQRGLRVIFRCRNGGKGAAVFHGLSAASVEGFTHVLIMDADGQHPASSIRDFMALSRLHPEALILGVPVFDRSAPRLRVVGRRVSNACARIETLGAVSESLFGFRIYPIASLQSIMESTRWMRRFDFDTEAAVRLSWHGLPVISCLVPVRYLRTGEGGVSHFRYGRDNLVLATMHARLMAGFIRRLPRLAEQRFKPFRR